MTTSPSSHVVALLGRGIGESRSPGIHEAEAREHGLPLAYRLADFEALGWENDELARTVRQFATMGFSGCNVTYPFKQQVVDLCDSLGEDARHLQAVNTLVFRDGRIHGENTDLAGFCWLVERDIGDIRGARVAQVGTGGAGSATAYGLARLGAAEVALFDPAMERAALLAARYGGIFPETRFIACSSAQQAVAGRDGVVNATPVGMASVPGTPFDPALMSASQWCVDIVYFPLETPLLAHARRNGQRVANGVSMVIGQAAEALRLFTDIAPDRGRMYDRLTAAIARQRAGNEGADQNQEQGG